MSNTEKTITKKLTVAYQCNRWSQIIKLHFKSKGDWGLIDGTTDEPTKDNAKKNYQLKQYSIMADILK